MGVVVISGTCAAVTSLMLLCRYMLMKIINATGNPAKTTLNNTAQRWTLPPLLALGSAILMATGLAGDELLEVLLRGALILWLLYFFCICLAALTWIWKQSNSLPLPAGICTLTLLICMLTLIITNPHTIEICIFITSMLGFSCLLAAGWFLLHKTHNT